MTHDSPAFGCTRFAYLDRAPPRGGMWLERFIFDQRWSFSVWNLQPSVHWLQVDRANPKRHAYDDSIVTILGAGPINDGHT